ncbi:unnamed protein product [Ilex paraguariensis]|uniref:RING-CH-type domain-containing protein n=1 Tax=Ilex paraguariensis TaxID=185542 RepID=A0ABC8QYU1_9AQUA
MSTCKNTLAHSACASNQFRSRGNNECEVCDQEVEEVPVTLLRVPVPDRDNEPKEIWTAKLKR